jgi:alanine dehydrogenase
VVGTNALQMAVGTGARVTVLDKSIDRLRQLDLVYGNRIATLYSNAHALEEAVLSADLVIGGVLVPGAAAPKLVTRDMVSRMKKGAVVVDVAIDQGGCFETSHATTHTEPIYFVDGVLHYCVSNMPAAVPHTSTLALTNATFPYLLELANHGLEGACQRHAALREGVNTYKGFVTYKGVGESQGREWRAMASVA